jgi:hypothetical protein
MNLLVRLAYPDSPVPWLALVVIVTLLKSIWKYFPSAEGRENRVTELVVAFLEAKKRKTIFSQSEKLFKHGLQFFIEYDFVSDDCQVPLFDSVV